MERNNHGAAEERQRPLTNEDQRRLITKEELQAIMRELPAKRSPVKRMDSVYVGAPPSTEMVDVAVSTGMELQKKAPEKPKERRSGRSRCELMTTVNWLLCKMIHGKDWKGVEDLIGHHPEALTVNISDSKTIFHHIVNFTGDDIEAAREIDKLASKLNNPRTLEQQDSRGLTVLHLSAITGMKSASETLVKYNGNLPNAWSNDIWLPVHYAAYYGKKDTVQYLVSVTAKENLVNINGARLISYLINSNLYDVALDILKENPEIGRDHIRSRKMVLKTLAGKPSAFASGTQLGCLRFIYNWIPVKKEKVSSIDQTNKNRSADVDVENGISEIYSTNSTSFGFLPKITTFFCT